MKTTNLILITILSFFIFSCEGLGIGEEPLPKKLYETEAGLNKLTNYITSHYENLEEEMEVMEFSYYATISVITKDISSSMRLTIVKGDNKDKIVEYKVDNDGFLKNTSVDITVGGPLNEKISNDYETYAPYLFSSKEINLENIKKAIATSKEKMMEETNVENAYCKSISIEKDSKDPKISITIAQNKFASTISRNYKWKMDGVTKSK